jgi:hypothetical protein
LFGSHEGLRMSDPAAPDRERRVHRRRIVDAPMWIVIGETRVAVTAVNVSIGGAAVHSPAKASVGTMIRLEVELAASISFTLDAEVVRVSQDVLGLRFLALGQHALESLLDASGILREREPERDDPSGVRHGALRTDEEARQRRGAAH